MHATHLSRRSFIEAAALAACGLVLGGSLGGEHVLEQAEKIGLGRRTYQLVEVGA